MKPDIVSDRTVQNEANLTFSLCFIYLGLVAGHRSNPGLPRIRGCKDALNGSSQSQFLTFGHSSRSGCFRPRQ